MSGRTKLTETYTLPNIKQSNVHYVATEAVYQFSQQDKVAFDVIFRVSDRDVAFRYKMYPQKRGLVLRCERGNDRFVLPEGVRLSCVRRVNLWRICTSGMILSRDKKPRWRAEIIRWQNDFVM